MSESSAINKNSSRQFQYDTLEEYLVDVRKVLVAGRLRPEWADELIAGDTQYLTSCFENKHHPADAASEVFITEDDMNRDPEQEDQSIKIDINHQIKNYLTRLAELGLWGDSIEEAARLLIMESLSSKIESGLLKPV